MCVSGAVVAAGMASAGAMGFSGGAPEYFNGSPASFLTSCIACHAEFDENSGDGGVTILLAPTRYVLDQTYTLRVRVFDPGQAGAGFQLSAEDATGTFRGQLIVSDTENTRSAGNNPDVDFITHTSDGKANAIANWLAMGEAAEFTVQWRAPQGDAGTIGLYAAGNAVNDADGLAGDYVYTTSTQMVAAALGDLNGDGEINTADLGLLISAFGTGDAVADLNDDLIVDTADLGLLLGVFGS